MLAPYEYQHVEGVTIRRTRVFGSVFLDDAKIQAQRIEKAERKGASSRSRRAGDREALAPV